MPIKPAEAAPSAPWPRTWAHPVNAFLLGSLWIASAAVFASLPDRIPMHFGLGGTPDRWADRTLGSWMALPIIASGQAASLPWWAMGSVLALLLSSPLSTVVILLRTNSTINRLSKRHE